MMSVTKMDGTNGRSFLESSSEILFRIVEMCFCHAQLHRDRISPEGKEGRSPRVRSDRHPLGKVDVIPRLCRQPHRAAVFLGRFPAA